MEFISHYFHLLAMPIAKIVFSLFLLLLSFFGLVLLVNYRRIMHKLQVMEHSADLERDNAMFNFTVARANLAELKSKLSIPLLQAAAPRVDELLSHVGALAFLVIRRDPNLFKWGKTITNLAKSAYSYFKSKSYNM